MCRPAAQRTDAPGSCVIIARARSLNKLGMQQHQPMPHTSCRSLAQHAVELAQLGLPTAAESQGTGGRGCSTSACVRAGRRLLLCLRRLRRPCRISSGGSGGGSGGKRGAFHACQEGAARLRRHCLVCGRPSGAGGGGGWRRRALLVGVGGSCAARVVGACRWRRRRGSTRGSGSPAGALGPQVAERTRHGARLSRCSRAGRDFQSKGSLRAYGQRRSLCSVLLWRVMMR